MWQVRDFYGLGLFSPHTFHLVLWGAIIAWNRFLCIACKEFRGSEGRILCQALKSPAWWYECVGYVFSIKWNNACKGYHVGCVQKLVAFILIPVLVSQGSRPKICDFPTPVVSLLFSWLWLSFHFCYSECLEQFLSYFSVCQIFTFLEGCLDFSLGRGKFLLLLFASLPSLLNLLL